MQDSNINPKLMDPMTKKSCVDFLVVPKAQMHQKLGFAYFQSSQNYTFQSLDQKTQFKV